MQMEYLPTKSMGNTHVFVVSHYWPESGQVMVGQTPCGKELAFDIPPRNFAAPAVAQPVARTPGVLQNPKDVLVTAAAATLLLVGLLSLPGVFQRDAVVSAQPRTIPEATTIPAAQTAESLSVVNSLRLPNGMTFEAVETATGTMTVVADIPAGIETTMQVGDVLLVYGASGESLGTGTALRDILQREFSAGVTTYGFVIRRGTSTMDADFRLGVAG